MKSGVAAAGTKVDAGSVVAQHNVRRPTTFERRCACGQHTSEGECRECRKKRPGVAEDYVEQCGREGGVVELPLDPTPDFSRIRPHDECEHDARGASQVLSKMSRAYGMSFSDVRIRTDAAAARIVQAHGTQALTDGQSILFAPGAFCPGTRSGDHVIAHEFAHVAQARGGTPGTAGLNGRCESTLGGWNGRTWARAYQTTSNSTSNMVEVAANMAADRVLKAEQVTVRGAPIDPRGVGYSPNREKHDTEQGASSSKIRLPPKGYWYRVTDGETFIYVFNPEDLAARSDAQVAAWVYRTYCKEIFNVEHELADKAGDALSVHLKEQGTLNNLPKDQGHMIRILPGLHYSSVEYFKNLGIEAKKDPKKVVVSEYSDEEADGGADGDASGATQAPKQRPGNGQLGGKIGGTGTGPPQEAQVANQSADSPELIKARELFRTLQQEYPEAFRHDEMKGVSEIDLLQFIAKNPDLFKNLPPIPKGGNEIRDLAKFKDFLEKWKTARQEHLGTGDSPGQGGGTAKNDGPAVKMLHPAGQIVVTPTLDPAKGEKYIKGSTVDARMSWEGEAKGWLDAFPNWALFDWKLFDDKTNRVESSPFFGASYGKDEWSVDIPEKSGFFRLTLNLSSTHFYGQFFSPPPVMMVTTDEATREKEVFNTAFVGEDSNKPFSRGKDGKLKLKDGQPALSIDDEFTMLDTQIGAIDALTGQGKLSAEEAKRFKEYYENEKKALVALQKKAAGSRTYFVRASFVSRENSASIPIMRTYMVRDTAVTNYDPDLLKATAYYKVTLYDTTLDQVNFTQHPGEGSAPVKKGAEAQAYTDAERAAIVAMVAHVHSHNDYPRGTIRIAIQLQQSSDVYEATINTNNWKKPAEKAIGYVGMAAGVGLIVLAPFTGGSSVVVGLVLVGSVAGLLGAGLALEEQYAKEGTIKVDSRLALNLLTIATSLVGLSEVSSIRAGFQAVKSVSRGMMLAKAGFNLGAAGVQGIIISHEVVRLLEALEAQYRPKLAGLTKGTPEYESVEREYKSAVSQVMGAAAVNGAFVLVAVGQGIHGLKEIPAPGPMSKKTYKVQSETIDMVQGFSKTRDPRLIAERLKSGLVTPEERAYLEEALGKFPAKSPSELPAQPEPLRTTSEPPTTTSEPPTATGEPPTATSEPPKATSEPPKATSEPPTATSEPPKATSEPPKATSEPPKATDEPPKAGEPATPSTDKPAAIEAQPAKSPPSIEVMPTGEIKPPTAEKPSTKEPGSETPPPVQTPSMVEKAPLTPEELLAARTAAAKEAYRAAKAKPKRYGGEYDSEQAFIDRYTDPNRPKRYNLETDRWVNEATEYKPSERFDATTTVDAAMEKFTGANSTSSFKPFHEMLVTEGIATESEVREALKKLLGGIKAKNGRSIDDVRHDLKEAFKVKLFERMFTSKEGAVLTPEQSHDALLRMTKKLNSADKGNLTEQWIDLFRGLDPDGPKAGEVPKHVRVTQKEHPELGLAKDRVLDRLEGNTLNEVKSGDGPLSDHDLAQHADNMKIIGKEGGTPITVEEGKPPQIVQKAKLTFTSPEGAKTNVDWIVEQLGRNKNLSVEVFNAAHQRQVYDRGTMGEQGAAIRGFLQGGK